MTINTRERDWAGILEVVRAPSSFRVEIIGTSQSDGTVLFQGPAQPPGPPAQTAIVTALRVKTDSRQGLIGQLHFTWRNAGSTNVQAYDAEIPSASTSGLVPGSFHGAFRGKVVMTQCLAGSCEDARPDLDLRFNIAQAANSAVGMAKIWELEGLPDLPLAGSVADGTLRVAGELSSRCEPFFGERSVCLQRVSNFAATVDDAGRLHGSFELARDGYFGIRHYAYTAVLEFRTVNRE